ncbi:unnamed protein product [Spirodela intermedia]|uniref:Protein kinase domain-containing protein n=1 Tax=Spirodela intermedia TaxID=51605 RepID=A0A7I8JMH3_SPIIN|nr:unnamed protein product [Spirodela intermedia]CAA6671300.1 unnamed protein product [Spirodela intermedia]
MATGRPPWPDVADPIAAIHRIAFSAEAPELPSHLSDGARDFLGKCLDRDPRKRLSAAELLDHPSSAATRRPSPRRASPIMRRGRILPRAFSIRTSGNRGDQRTKSRSTSRRCTRLRSPSRNASDGCRASAFRRLKRPRRPGRRRRTPGLPSGTAPRAGRGFAPSDSYDELPTKRGTLPEDGQACAVSDEGHMPAAATTEGSSLFGDWLLLIDEASSLSNSCTQFSTMMNSNYKIYNLIAD